LNRDTTAIKDKINTMVTAYNDAMSMLGVVSDPKSTVETYGATLVGDSTVRLIKQQLRSMMMGASSTTSNGMGAMWQMGVSVDQTGVMSVDATKLDAALTNNFDDVVKAMTGNQNSLAATSSTPGGIAGDAFKKLSVMLGARGPMLTRSEAATTQNTKYQQNLTDLSTRMDKLLERYQKQFAAMNSLVGSVNSQKTSLKSTFDGMMAQYTNN
jgi:flagellar hook-associated protein 2